jgi:hypothetical protein
MLVGIGWNNLHAQGFELSLDLEVSEKGGLPNGRLADRLFGNQSLQPRTYAPWGLFLRNPGEFPDLTEEGFDLGLP